MGGGGSAYDSGVVSTVFVLRNVFPGVCWRCYNYNSNGIIYNRSYNKLLNDFTVIKNYGNK